MRLGWFLLIMLLSFVSVANAQTVPPTRFVVKTTAGEIPVDGFESGSGGANPVVLVLSGTKGFAAPAYDEIGRRFHEAGLDVYLVHVLSPYDVSAIAGAGSAPARISYYARRFASWTTTVQDVVSYFGTKRHRRVRIGLLGISLGAEIAATAAAGNEDVQALVLVDGGFPEGVPPPTRPLPPLQLIWGANDRVFPTAQALSRKAQELGGSVNLNVYNDGQHNFFLKPKAPETQAAYTQAVSFLVSRLLANP